MLTILTPDEDTETLCRDVGCLFTSFLVEYIFQSRNLFYSLGVILLGFFLSFLSFCLRSFWFSELSFWSYPLWILICF